LITSVVSACKLVGYSVAAVARTVSNRTGSRTADRPVPVDLSRGHLQSTNSAGIFEHAPAQHSAFYGFQWQSLAFLETAIAPIARKLRLEGVETVLRDASALGWARRVVLEATTRRITRLTRLR